MKDPSAPLQKAAYAVLRGGLAASVGVFDNVPLDSSGKLKGPFPYVAIGEDDIHSDRDQCHDACTAYLNFHVFSRAVGRMEAKTIMAECLVLLDVKLAVEGFEVISSLVSAGPKDVGSADGLTTHRVATLRYRLGPTA